MDRFKFLIAGVLYLMSLNQLVLVPVLEVKNRTRFLHAWWAVYIKCIFEGLSLVVHCQHYEYISENPLFYSSENGYISNLIGHSPLKVIIYLCQNADTVLGFKFHLHFLSIDLTHFLQQKPHSHNCSSNSDSNNACGHIMLTFLFFLTNYKCFHHAFITNSLLCSAFFIQIWEAHQNSLNIYQWT